MRNFIKTGKIEEERERWVAALDDDEILRLASSVRGRDKCIIFQPRKRGSYNICFFVEFDSPPERWVVRIPIPMCIIPKDMLDEKTEVELATMRYVSPKTTLPIPKVHAYAFSDTGLNGLPYIIMDYVDGRSLKDLDYGTGPTWGYLVVGDADTPASKHLHQQLADVYVQLRQLQFPKIGALGLPSHNTPALSCDPEEIRVSNRPLSIDVVLQEIDGLEPGLSFPPRKPVNTAKEFAAGLLSLAANKLEKEADQTLDEKKPGSVLYAAHHFERFVRQEWLDHTADEGPFVLTHGDMEHFAGNILFDKDYNLVGIVDWEWSRVVPAQFMVPPLWLAGSQLDIVLMVQASYNKIVGYLRAAVQERERAVGLPPILSTEPHTAVVIGLNYPDLAFDDEDEGVFEREAAPRIREFLEASEERQAFLELKIKEQFEFFEEERQHWGNKTARSMIATRSFI
ncbi:kinase-like domain-containing protein [Staphylotrichum tortipilum]|uniref:Kinase-like domain-containing protein n=1 Tax=Staphylotrichum tortipilum TaxID=2831512 RepID=A0AAN6RWE8_9PEZI|nr:kinase-like domain-containing protein [Staphylotrichum longicolle]